MKTNEDIFGWDGWEKVLDFTTHLAEDLNDDEETSVAVFCDRLAQGIGWTILGEWKRQDYRLAFATSLYPDPFVPITGNEVRERLRRLRAWVAQAAAEPCPACGEPVKPGHKGRRYCSNACRQKAYRERARKPESAVTKNSPSHLLDYAENFRPPVTD